MRPPTSSLVQTTAVSVATILGTGILGLPVSLHASGFYPFLLTFTFNLFAQVGVVVATVEILQRGHQLNAESLESSTQYEALVPAKPVVNDDPGAELGVTHYSTAPHPSTPPSLHSLAQDFLPSTVPRLLFNFVVLAHFLFILSAYALAGPQALSSLIPPLKTLPAWVLPTVFVILAGLAVTCYDRILIPPLTAGTALKAGLLSVLVFVILIRGMAIREHFESDWHPRVLVDPFLMGTFALNGVVNLMPVTFQTCLDACSAREPNTSVLDAAFVSAYRWATIIGVFICYLLNAAWCLAILLCVPQGVESIQGNTRMQHVRGAMFSEILRSEFHHYVSNSTLALASESGQISTIPLIEVLKARGDGVDWIISLMVNIFIVLSVIISFLVMSVGMKHYIDGGVQSTSSRMGHNPNIRRWVMYFSAFAVVLTTAVANPTALLKIMEGFTSLSLNVEAGLFVSYMFIVGRQMGKSIPAPLPIGVSRVLISVVLIYFATAVLVDAFFYIPNSFH